MGHLTGCGGAEDAVNRLGEKTFQVLSGRTTLTVASKEIKGTGRILFDEPREDALVVSLGGVLEEGASVDVFFFARENGRDGATFTLQRENDQLKVIWVGPFGNVDVLDAKALRIGADGKFGLQIGWSNKNQQLLVVSDKDTSSPSTYAISTEGQGTKWGLELHRATITYAIF